MMVLLVLKEKVKTSPKLPAIKDDTNIGKQYDEIKFRLEASSLDINGYSIATV